MPDAAAEPLAIVAGGGPVPLHVAAAAAAHGRRVRIVGIAGEADKAIEGFDHIWLSWGEIGRIDAILKAHGRDVVIVGNIRQRPDFKGIKLDWATMRAAKDVFTIIIGGDDTVLTGAVRFLEKRGLRVIGAHEVAPDLVAGAGALGKRAPDRRQRKDVEAAVRAAEAIGRLDAGQAAVVVEGRVIALEAAEGTDAMLERVASIRAAGRARWSSGTGAFAKCAKPQQDLRVDMPTIGTRTVEGVIAAGLGGIAISAGKVMIVDRPEVIRRADAAGIFVTGVVPS
ncbi:MAG TPA: UDP-2,3-diacylglucosamine diphosphatase LpxI [Bauldia sp.]|nr:UDP-2,3-diacylglucosamine diphosphatase LpxI [Bauldia sp.]